MEIYLFNQGVANSRNFQFSYAKGHKNPKNELFIQNIYFQRLGGNFDFDCSGSIFGVLSQNYYILGGTLF